MEHDGDRPIKRVALSRLHAMANQRGIAVDNRVQDSDFDDCDALLEGRMGDGWQLFFQTADVQVRPAHTHSSRCGCCRRVRTSADALLALVRSRGAGALHPAAPRRHAPSLPRSPAPLAPARRSGGV